MKKKKRPGLWANIQAKRKRIKAGSGERMRKISAELRPELCRYRASKRKKR